MPLYTSESTPLPNRHIRTAPCTPQWQRKLKSPLRVLIAALNAHPDTHGKKIVILWKSLTIMKPMDEREFVPDHTAYARLFYEEVDGTFQGCLEVVNEFAAILQSTPQGEAHGEESLWNQQWNLIQWGTQLELDEAEKRVYDNAKQQCITTGKGVSAGKGRRHWSAAFLHNSHHSTHPTCSISILFR